jgi:hypothetical protein
VLFFVLSGGGGGSSDNVVVRQHANECSISHKKLAFFSRRSHVFFFSRTGTPLLPLTTLSPLLPTIFLYQACVVPLA